MTDAKAELRRRIYGLRDELSYDQRLSFSQDIAKNFMAISELAAAKTVALYANIRSEVITRPLIDMLFGQDKVLAMPRADRTLGSLIFHRVKDPDTELCQGSWGIPEPDPSKTEKLELADLDIVVVPGVAFDRKGGRLDAGGGYFERLFSSLRFGVLRVGLAFTIQIVPRVPVGPNEPLIDVVVTEQDVIRIKAVDKSNL